MNYIKEQVKKNRTTCKDLAEQLGVSNTDISNYISEQRYPNHDRLILMTQILKCKITDLYPNAKRKVTWDLKGELSMTEVFRAFVDVQNQVDNKMKKEGK